MVSSGGGGFEPMLDGIFVKSGHYSHLVYFSLRVYGACMIWRLGTVLEYLCRYIFFWKSTRYCAQEKLTFDC